MKTKRKKHNHLQTNRGDRLPEKQPLIEHLRELKRRVFFVALAVGIGSVLAYSVERTLLDWLLRPSHGQNFIYTSPMGGINFLFGVCLDIGLIFSTPFIIYNILAFLKPLMHGTTHRFVVLSSLAATLLAITGVAFGYFLGLPSALHFLFNQFVTIQVKPLITIEAYLSFVSMYMLMSALMFQIPLLLLLINRIKPLRPRTLLKYERHVLLGAVIIGFIMNPTPNVVDQMLIVVPVFVVYQVGILLVWLTNRKGRKHKASVAPTKAFQPHPTAAIPLSDDDFADVPRQILVPATPSASVQRPIAPPSQPQASPIISDFVTHGQKITAYKPQPRRVPVQIQTIQRQSYTTPRNTIRRQYAFDMIIPSKPRINPGLAGS